MTKTTAYLDHAASTRVRPAAADALADLIAQEGNPSSLHSPGRRARGRIEEAREWIASQIGTGPDAVIFTSGGTEANNLAIKGTFLRERGDTPPRSRVLIGSTEHPSVTAPSRWLGRRFGADVQMLAVDSTGRVVPEDLERVLACPGAVSIVSIMAANNETGVISRMGDLARVCRGAGVRLHVDAVQAAAWYSIPELAAAVGGVGQDGGAVVSLAVSGHKLGAPVGVGALLGLDPPDVEPLIHGGGQEHGARSGTSPAALIASLGTALRESGQSAGQRRDEIGDLRDYFVKGVAGTVPDAECHTPLDRDLGLAGHALMSFPGAPADALLMVLDREGVAASAGSACSAGLARPSAALTAMGVEPERARSAIRFTLGWPTSRGEIDYVLSVLPGAVAAARRAASSSARR